MVNEITIHSPSETAKLNIVANLSNGQLPYQYLRVNTKWEPFWCPDEFKLGPSPVIVRVSRPKPNQNTRSFMGICEHVSGELWVMGRIDNHVRVRDIKNLQNQSDVNRTRSDLDTTDLIKSWTIQPDWKTENETYHKLDMKYHVKDASFSGNPAKELRTKYIDTLYSHTPLSYFAKSTLSRVRTAFKSLEEQSSNRSYLKGLNAALKSLVLDIRTIDEKFTKLELSEPELAKYKQLTEDVSSKKHKSIQEGLKLREIQLQIIVLLELMTLSDDPQIDSALPTTVSTKENMGQKPRKLGLVRRKPSAKKETPAVAPTSVSSNTEISVPVHIDILFDRLCIFQALEGLGQSNVSSPYSDKQEKSQDKVLEFCLEVILPFYGNKLPTFIKSMVKKVRGMSAKRTTRVTSTNSNATQGDSEARASLSPVAVAKKSSTLTTSPVNSKKATRKASVKSLQSNQKRQVDLIPSFKSIRDENVQAELAKAIKNVAKPNRAAVSLTESAPKPRTVTNKKPDVQVTMTPIKKRIVAPTYLGPITPVKRPKFEDVMSSPISAIITDEDT